MKCLGNSHANLMQCWWGAETLHQLLSWTILSQLQHQQISSLVTSNYFFMSIQISQSVLGTPTVSSYSFTSCMTLDNSYYKANIFCAAFDFSISATIKIHREPQVLGFCVFLVLSLCSMCRFWRQILIDYVWGMSGYSFSKGTKGQGSIVELYL